MGKVETGNWFDYNGGRFFRHCEVFVQVEQNRKKVDIEIRNHEFEKSTYIGGYERRFSQFCGGIIPTKINGVKLFDSEGNEIGKLPYFPTFSMKKGWISGSYWSCDQLTENENENLNIIYKWNGGKSYSVKYNESEFDWVMKFWLDPKH